MRVAAHDSWWPNTYVQSSGAPAQTFALHCAARVAEQLAETAAPWLEKQHAALATTGPCKHQLLQCRVRLADTWSRLRTCLSEALHISLHCSVLTDCADTVRS